jgi:hypothetical protein
MDKKPRRQVFIAARFGPGFDRLLEVISKALSSASDTLGIELVRFDESSPSTLSILDLIREQIGQADLMIADVSGPNPNVMWEIGFAQALKKPTLILSEQGGDVPFDLRDRRVLLYRPTDPMPNLVARLTEALVDSFREMLPPESGKPAMPARRPGRVFVSYSHADEEFLHRILVHLRPLEREGLIDLWSDGKIRVGDRWREEIRRELADARIAVLLVSADFLASEFIITNELPPLLVAAEEKGTRIMPVIVKPSRFLRDDRLSRFQALNDPRYPVIRMNEAEREELYAKLGESIELELGPSTFSDRRAQDV